MVFFTNPIPFWYQAKRNSGKFSARLTSHNGIPGPSNLRDQSSAIIPKPEIPPATKPDGSKKFWTPSANSAVPVPAIAYAAYFFILIFFASPPFPEIIFVSSFSGLSAQTSADATYDATYLAVLPNGKTIPNPASEISLARV